MQDVPKHEHVFVLLMDANASMGLRRGGKLEREKCNVLGACGRDTLNGNG